MTENKNNKKKQVLHGREIQKDMNFYFRTIYWNLSIKISNAILKYLQALEVNTELLDIYYQRSWATFTENDQV